MVKLGYNGLNLGEVITIPIKCSRESPRLVCYVYKSNGMSFTEPERIPGFNGFSFKRQRAVNNTVDCGSCFATEHVLVSLIVTNVGNRGKFFWLTEDDFLNRDVNVRLFPAKFCSNFFIPASVNKFGAMHGWFLGLPVIF